VRRRRLRDWWVTAFGGRCDLCERCRRGPLTYETVTMGPPLIAQDVEVATCTRCGHSWELW
jgi:hypothetical protein